MTFDYEKYLEIQDKIKSFITSNFDEIEGEVNQYKQDNKLPVPGSKLLEAVEMAEEYEAVYALAEVIGLLAEIKLDKVWCDSSVGRALA